jgi:ferredoxin
VIYKITIDPSLCSGFGSCAQEAPGTFHLEAGTATAVRTTSDARVLDAAAACPMGAIAIEALEAAA